jgi:hypothetical protein
MNIIYNFFKENGGTFNIDCPIYLSKITDEYIIFYVIIDVGSLTFYWHYLYDLKTNYVYQDYDYYAEYDGNKLYQRKWEWKSISYKKNKTDIEIDKNIEMMNILKQYIETIENKTI